MQPEDDAMYQWSHGTSRRYHANHSMHVSCRRCHSCFLSALYHHPKRVASTRRSRLRLLLHSWRELSTMDGSIQQRLLCFARCRPGLPCKKWPSTVLHRHSLPTNAVTQDGRAPRHMIATLFSTDVSTRCGTSYCNDSRRKFPRDQPLSAA